MNHFVFPSFCLSDVTRFIYRLTEHREDGIVHALHAFAIGVHGHVQMAIYFDNETDLDLTRQISNSLTETPAS